MCQSPIATCIRLDVSTDPLIMPHQLQVRLAFTLTAQLPQLLQLGLL